MMGSVTTIVFLHAHPDDETIMDGATMAKYVAEGAAVCVVTCTLGEEGEVLVEDLAHLGAEHRDDLGSHRLGELKLAMEILGPEGLAPTGQRTGGLLQMPEAGTENSPLSWVETFMSARAGTIYAGSSQVQRNIIGEQLLGLPKEPGDLAKVPFNELPRNG